MRECAQLLLFILSYSCASPHYSYVIFNAVTPQTAPLSYSLYSSLSHISPLSSPPRMLAAVAVIKADFFIYYKKTAFTVVSRLCCVHIFFYFVFHFFFLFYAQAYQAHVSLFKSDPTRSPLLLLQFNILVFPFSDLLRLPCLLCNLINSGKCRLMKSTRRNVVTAQGRQHNVSVCMYSHCVALFTAQTKQTKLIKCIACKC